MKLKGDEDEDSEEEREKDKANDLKMSRQPSRESTLSPSSAFFPSETESEDEDEDEGHERKGNGRGIHAGKDKERQPGRSSTADRSKVGGSSKLNGGRSEQPPQEREVEVEKEVPLREQEEEEIVALSSYLASARRGWPWMGQNVLWAEYVSLNGHHRCVVLC